MALRNSLVHSMITNTPEGLLVTRHIQFNPAVFLPMWSLDSDERWRGRGPGRWHGDGGSGWAAFVMFAGIVVC